MGTSYNPWPLGQLPKAMQRREPEMVRAAGYHWDDPRELLTLFERKVADFAGAKYAVAVDCCTHAMELSIRYLLKTGEFGDRSQIYMPVNTYVSCVQMLYSLGIYPCLLNEEWSGIYQLAGTRVWDGAVRWKQGMYIGDDALHCLSFQIKKTIPIGRGGMVLTDDKAAADWIRLASYDGRDLSLAYDHPHHVKIYGFHYYMTPEDAARGILLMDMKPAEGDSASWENYPDVQKMLRL